MRAKKSVRRSTSKPKPEFTYEELALIAGLVASDALLTTAEAAAWLRISPGRLAIFRHEGRGPRATLVCTRVRYKGSDLIAWVNSFKTPREVSPDVGRPPSFESPPM